MTRSCACRCAKPSAAYLTYLQLDLPAVDDAKTSARQTGGRHAGALEQLELESDPEDAWGLVKMKSQHRPVTGASESAPGSLACLGLDRLLSARCCWRCWGAMLGHAGPSGPARAPSRTPAVNPGRRSGVLSSSGFTAAVRGLRSTAAVQSALEWRQ